jgi:hypothetical protein
MAVLCRDLEKNGMVRAWHGRGMTSVNQARLHCVNQMGMSLSKPLVARHGMGMAWVRHATCEWAFRMICCYTVMRTDFLCQDLRQKHKICPQ